MLGLSNGDRSSSVFLFLPQWPCFRLGAGRLRPIATEYRYPNLTQCRKQTTWVNLLLANIFFLYKILLI